MGRVSLSTTGRATLDNAGRVTSPAVGQHQYGILSVSVSHSRKISSASGNGRRVIGRLRAANLRSLPSLARRRAAPSGIAPHPGSHPRARLAPASPIPTWGMLLKLVQVRRWGAHNRSFVQPRLTSSRSFRNSGASTLVWSKVPDATLEQDTYCTMDWGSRPSACLRIW